MWGDSSWDELSLGASRLGASCPVSLLITPRHYMASKFMQAAFYKDINSFDTHVTKFMYIYHHVCISDGQKWV